MKILDKITNRGKLSDIVTVKLSGTGFSINEFDKILSINVSLEYLILGHCVIGGKNKYEGKELGNWFVG